MLKELIRRLRNEYPNERDAVAITASTVIAACNIGGITLRSFAGIGSGMGEAAAIVQRINENITTRERWLRTKVLIIDEISMVDRALFDKLEAIARMLRLDPRPFGGIQLVITGDFFQLPPFQGSGFAFESLMWQPCIQYTIELCTVFRQKDPDLAAMLNDLRTGRPNQRTILALSRLSRELSFSDGIEAIELFPTCGQVEMANNSRLERLAGATQQFESYDVYDPSLSMQDRMTILNGFMAPRLLELKSGSQVMLIKDKTKHLVNGTLGRVIGFMKKTNTLSNRNQESFFQSSDNRRAGDLPWPLVQFGLTDGSTQLLLCPPEKWRVEYPNRRIQAARVQVPLVLGWAMSLHKSQGLALNRAKVQLNKTFEGAQAYVALSRATSQDGLQVIGPDYARFKAHPAVLIFYDNLRQSAKAADTFRRSNVYLNSRVLSGAKNKSVFTEGES